VSGVWYQRMINGTALPSCSRITIDRWVAGGA
jgi:hypothetical protein